MVWLSHAAGEVSLIKAAGYYSIMSRSVKVGTRTHARTYCNPEQTNMYHVKVKITEQLAKTNVGEHQAVLHGG